MNKDFKYVAVNGFGWSGSGAVVDLLQEFEGYWDCGGEVRFLRDPYGIFDLEHALVDGWDILNADAALRDFEWLAFRLYRRTSRWGGTGCGYIDKFGEGFWEETLNYINRLTKWDFQGHWWWFEFKQSDMKMAVNRILKRLHVRDFENMNRIRVTDLSKEEFEEITKEYINNLYRLALAKSNIGDCKTIILDQPFPMNQAKMAGGFLNDLKIIVVDRDPRDQYMDLLHGKHMIGREIARTHDVKKYIDYYNKKQREAVKKMSNGSDILYVRFEDLILKYEDTVNTIIDFLGEDKSIHTSPFKYLKPEVSSNNIGMWKQYPNQDEIRIIEKELLCD